MSTAKTGSLQERTRRITVKLFWWTAAWVVTLAIATFGPHFIWASRTMTLGAIAINLAAGAGMKRVAAETGVGGAARRVTGAAPCAAVDLFV